MEILRLYLEAENFLGDLERLVSDHAHSPIRSMMEFSEFYHLFLLASHPLFSKGHLSMLMEVCQFLVGFEPWLGSLVCTQLQRKFPDHFPEDLYSLDLIYDAALYALVWQSAVPLIETLHNVSPLSAPTIVSPKLCQLLPMPACTC